MEKYIRVDWPESQEFIGNDECQMGADDGVMFVPEELYNNQKQESLEKLFDKKKAEVDDAKKREWERLRKMDLDERAWVADMVGKLEFLESRGFTVRPYYGGIVDKWPHNYIQIEGKGRWVAIEGSSVRRADGTLDQTSPYIANYSRPTMEELIKIIAKW